MDPENTCQFRHFLKGCSYSHASSSYSWLVSSFKIFLYSLEEGGRTWHNTFQRFAQCEPLECLADLDVESLNIWFACATRKHF